MDAFIRPVWGPPLITGLLALAGAGLLAGGAAASESGDLTFSYHPGLVVAAFPLGFAIFLFYLLDGLAIRLRRRRLSLACASLGLVTLLALLLIASQAYRHATACPDTAGSCASPAVPATSAYMRAAMLIFVPDLVAASLVFMNAVDGLRGD